MLPRQARPARSTSRSRSRRLTPGRPIYGSFDCCSEPGTPGSLESFEADVRAAGTDPARLALAALHIMGTARMGGSPATSAVDPDGQSWDLPGLYVADASCFPTASGVNPMITIESIASMNATRLVARLS